jgi:N-acetyl-gamma-glutamyl-phosphate reductase
MIRVALEGASGYVGGELLSLLFHHPEVEVVAATAGQAGGERLAAIRPRFGANSMKLQTSLEPEQLKKLDLLFLALPHGESSKRIASIPRELPVIDLAADFRIADRARAEATYGPHPAWDYQSEFVYGLPELNRPRIREARRIAVPGCFATAASIALIPALEADVMQGPPWISAVTGSSGSGHRPAQKTHHPERALNFFGYQPNGHRHQPEIESALQGLNPSKFPLHLQVHSAPLVRGIYASAFFPVDPSADLSELYRRRFEKEPFVEVREEPPQLADVVGTPRATVSVSTRSESATVFVAIDNLLKGAASQAVQCMNLRFALPEDAGLRWPTGVLP